MEKRYSILVISLLISCGACVAQDVTDNYTVFDNYAGETKKEKKSEDYSFSTTYRIEAGYTQDWQNSKSTSYADTYLHGAKIGFTVDFNLPYHLSIQSGLFYQLTFGKNEQHWAGVNSEYTTEEYIEHNLLKHSVVVPVYATYTQKLWKELALYLYTGPQFAIGIAQKDNIKCTVSDETKAWLEANEIPTQSYEKYKAGELRHFNLQWGLGGGFQWANYRVYSGYNFGLNNIVKSNSNYLKGSSLWEWNWFVSFSYAF